jgi:hypothetical protein
MQSAKEDETVTIKSTVLNTSNSIYDNDDMKGLYRGVTRIGRRSVWLALRLGKFEFCSLPSIFWQTCIDDGTYRIKNLQKNERYS